VGYGYRVDVEDALNKVHDILENYDEYRAKVEEWRQKVLNNEYRWDLIAEKLVKVIYG
jgi:glycosyltransferase involved in cell wall biosynthesis